MDEKLHKGPKRNPAELREALKTAKIRFELLPPQALAEVAKVTTYGSMKYASYLWKQNCTDGNSEQFLGAILRHTYKYQQGEVIDPETGLHHLAHAACNCLFLIWHEKRLAGEL